MVAPHQEFTTTTFSFLNSTSRALAAGARSHSILRGTLDFRPVGRCHQLGWRRVLMRGASVCSSPPCQALPVFRGSSISLLLLL